MCPPLHQVCRHPGFDLLNGLGLDDYKNKSLIVILMKLFFNEWNLEMSLDELFIVFKVQHAILAQLLRREAFVALKAGDAENPSQVQVSINLGHVL